MNKIPSLPPFSGFLRDRRGATAMIFALAAIPATLMVGASIDLGRVGVSRMRLQKAVDAAALTVAAQGAGSDASTIAANVVRNQFHNGESVTTTATVDMAEGVVSVRATLGMPTTVMQLARVDKIDVTANATAAIGASGGKRTEIVIAFDTTGSMGANDKLPTAKQAAKDLVESVMKFPSGESNPNVKVGLVPFTNHVNVGLGYRNASWLSNSKDYTVTGTPRETCSTSYPNAVYGPPVTVEKTCYNDGAPYDCSSKSKPLIDKGEPVTTCKMTTPKTTYKWSGCVGSQGSQSSPADESDVANAANPVPALLNNANCPAALIRVGAAEADLDKAVDAMKAKGETYIPAGMLWAWRLLSPNEPFADGAAYDQSQKIIVLMTDGANTRSARYPDHEGTNADAANAKLTNVCKAIKATGIRIFTVAFQVSDTAIKDILAQCASSPPYHYDAQTNPQLLSAFHLIGQQITGLRLVK